MKFLVLALFVAAAVAAPIDNNNDAVEVIVNGVPEGTPLELGGIVDMHLNEHVNGQLAASTNLLHPYTAVGLAEAAAAAAEEIAPTPIQIVEKPETEFLNTEPIVIPGPGVQKPGIIVPAPIEHPAEPVAPVEIPAPIVMPSPVAPEVHDTESIVMPEPMPPMVVPSPGESIVMPEPVPPMVVPEPGESIVMPAPIPPMVIPEPQEPVPEPAAQGPSDIYNDGIVQVQYNGPNEPSMYESLQGWFNLVLNYISKNFQSTQQIV